MAKKEAAKENNTTIDNNTMIDNNTIIDNNTLIEKDTAKNETIESTYEQLLEQVEQILGQLDHKEIPLDEAVSMYKKGMELIEACNNKLDRAEKELKIIEGV